MNKDNKIQAVHVTISDRDKENIEVIRDYLEEQTGVRYNNSQLVKSLIALKANEIRKSK